MTFPATSVENETHFSLMKLLKSSLRNQMGPELLNALWRVCRVKHSAAQAPSNSSMDSSAASSVRNAATMEYCISHIGLALVFERRESIGGEWRLRFTL